MPTIRLYDGTRDVRFGKALLPAIGEIAKYRTMYCTGPVPGSIDISGYTIVKQAEQAAYNPLRRQVDYTELILNVVNCPGVGASPGIDTVVLSEEDFYCKDLVWSFGAAT